MEKGMEKIVKHGTSKQHQDATRQYLVTKYHISNDRTVISGLITRERRQVEKNREVFKRMIDVTLFLANKVCHSEDTENINILAWVMVIVQTLAIIVNCYCYW